MSTEAAAEDALNALAERFAYWRQARASPAERIPSALWAEAARLSSVLPSSRVAKRLRVDSGALKRQRHAQLAAPVPTFVEVALPAPAQGAEVELARPDGARLRIRYTAELPLAAVVQAFFS